MTGAQDDTATGEPAVGPGPLAPVDGWPVDTVAAAVVDRGGVRHAIGDVHHPFPLASVTKALWATAVLVAVEEEALGLDDPAGPEGSTVRHLLAHASGLSMDGGVLTRPGRRRIYSNAGFDVLGDAVRAASGLPPATYLAEAVCEPLGMTASHLDGSPARAAVSTVADLARFARTLLGAGPPAGTGLLAPVTLAGATAVAFPGLDGVTPGYGRQSPNDWGLGYEVRGAKDPHWTSPANSPATFGHFGRSGTFLWVDPVAGVALVVLTDRAFEAWAKPLWPALSTAVLAGA